MKNTIQIATQSGCGSPFTVDQTKPPWKEDALMYHSGKACLCTWAKLSKKVEKIDTDNPKYYAYKYDLIPLLMANTKRKTQTTVVVSGDREYSSRSYFFYPLIH